MSKDVFLKLRTKEQSRDRLKSMLQAYNEKYKPVRKLKLSDLLTQGIDKFEKDYAYLIDEQEIPA